jgi:chemotaxis protein MotB
LAHSPQDQTNGFQGLGPWWGVQRGNAPLAFLLMALRGARRGGGGELSPWPGYVDALSTLLMVIIFVLLVFVLAQAFLSVTLSGQDKALDTLKQQMSQLTDMLALEKGKSSDLQLSVSQLSRDLQTANTARDSIAAQLAAAQAHLAQLSSDRDTAGSARDKLAAELSDAQSQLSANSRSNQALQAQIANLSGQNGQAGQQALALASQLADAKKQLADLQAARDALDKTVTVDRATIQARLSDLAKLTDQVQALTALRDQLEKQAQDAAVRATTAEQRQAATAALLQQEQNFSDSAKAQIALLNQQMDQLRAQLAQVSSALDASEQTAKQKDLQITNLGQRLNAALASKVEELQQYRSEFFGRLRQVLADKPGIAIVGDRFVLQSEVLFPVNGADISSGGADQIAKIADTFKQIIPEIPPGIDWVLQVNGFADKQPVHGAWPSNWELSSARSLTVLKLLIADGLPADHLAATGYGDTHPLDPADTPDAYAKNRRIELRLTDR